ncbi:MAG: GGDEF domain-containing protein [Bacteroidales bacterium]|nr:GGDEF domain-containing protein [Bacteroidales bacterium]
MATPRLLHSLFLVTIMFFITFVIGAMRDRLFLTIKFDGLTQIHNRLSLLENLQASQNNFNKNSISYGILYLDIDNFKIVNDNLGHIYGDDLLIEVCDIIKGLIRKKDIAGRIGGDEILVIINNVNSEKFIDIKQRIADAFVLYFEEKNALWNLLKPINISIGAIHSSELKSKNISLNDIIGLSDKQMYKEKGEKLTT